MEDDEIKREQGRQMKFRDERIDAAMKNMRDARNFIQDAKQALNLAECAYSRADLNLVEAKEYFKRG